MTPPISTDACTATVSASQQQQQPSSLTSLFMDDFDQFMLKDVHSDFNLFNQHHDLNGVDSDLFQFDKMNTFTNNLFDLNNLNDPQNHQLMSFNSNVDEYDEDDDDKFILDDDNELNQDFLANFDGQDINETLFGTEFNTNTNETLNAIREMAINEKQQQQLQHQLQAKHNRKHKNSTSSVSSVSMSSTIKKVATELQISTANIVSSYSSKQNSNIKSVPINYDYNHEQQKTDLIDNFNDYDNDFEDLLGKDDWEQMLDEDYISRLTADFNFNTNNINVKPQTPKKSQSNQPLVLVLSNNSTPSSSSSPSSLSSSSLSSPNYKTRTPITQITKLAPTTTNTKMITTSNVVKKMNSVVLNEQSNKLNTNSNKNIILKNKTNNVITTVNQNSSLINAKAKSLTKPLTGSMINATAQTISIIKSPVKKQIVSPLNQCDYSDIIDCVNPDQIFPYRLPLLRFIKSEIDEQETDRLNDEEEDEEEIDVVSVNHSYGSVNNLNNEHSLLNLNHHNYFHSVNKNLKTNQQQKQKNQVVLLKSINDPASNSVLANCLSQQQMQPIVTKTIKQQTVIETKKQNFIKTTKLNSTNSIVKQSAQIQQRKSLQQAKKTMNSKPSGQQQVNSIRIVANQKNDLVTKMQPTVNLNKDILVQPSTKFITMTSKIQQQQPQQPVKCQTITPTTNKPAMNQVPKIITTQNSFLKLNNFTNSTNLTAIKLTTNTNTSLNKLNTNIKKAPFVTNTKVKSPEQDTFDDEFYYEDEDFNRRLNASTNKVNKLKKEDFDDDLDDEDLDDDDLDDDDLDDDSSTSSSPSPGSSSSLLTSSGTSSGYSTPTKTKTKLDQKDSFDLNALNEKLNKKSINKKKSSTLSSVSSSSSLTLTSSKRNSRLSSMGYSSDNPAEKRAFHILSERQRRNDLKKLFETLRINIPALCDKQKASKLTILKAAVDHLAEVTNKKEKLCSVFDKEKQKHTKLMQQLKTLQQFNGQPLVVH